MSQCLHFKVLRVNSKRYVTFNLKSVTLVFLEQKLHAVAGILFFNIKTQLIFLHRSSNSTVLMTAQWGRSQDDFVHGLDTVFNRAFAAWCALPQLTKVAWKYRKIKPPSWILWSREKRKWIRRKEPKAETYFLVFRKCFPEYNNWELNKLENYSTECF